METIEETSVTAYRDELILEFIGTDENGDISVISYQFAFDDESPELVHPKQALDEMQIEKIQSALEAEGYQLKWPEPSTGSP